MSSSCAPRPPPRCVGPCALSTQHNFVYSCFPPLPLCPPLPDSGERGRLARSCVLPLLPPLAFRPPLSPLRKRRGEWGGGAVITSPLPLGFPSPLSPLRKRRGEKGWRRARRAARLHAPPLLPLWGWCSGRCLAGLPVRPGFSWSFFGLVPRP